MPGRWHRLLLFVVIAAAPCALLRPDPVRAQTREQSLWCIGGTGTTPVNFDQQIAGCTAVIDSGTLDDTSRARVLHIRGLAFIFKGDFASAISDLDAVARILPDGKLIFRARLNYVLAKFDLSAAELADIVAEDRYFDDPALPRDLYLARVRSGYANATEEFTANISKYMHAKRHTPSDYDQIEYEFFLDRQTPETLLATASSSFRQCDARYSIAQRSLLRGEREKAIDELKIAIEICKDQGWPHWTAQAELERLRR
jgi:tetratricopeptide (TPR) repeat protein